MNQLIIKQVTETDYPRLAFLAPAHALSTATMVLACSIEETLLGTVLLMKKDKNWGLTWIYVLPEYQKQGIGSKLLDRAILEARKNGARNLEVVLSGESKEELQFVSMLSQRDFYIDFQTEAILSLTRNQLKPAIFYSKPELLRWTKSSKESILPLRNVKPRQLDRFIKNRERRHNYVASRADYASADPNLSRLLISDAQIVGAILVDRTGEGTYSLELCFVEKDYLKALIRLMKNVSDQLLTAKEPLKQMEFSCGLESILTAAKKIFPEHEITNSGIITAWKNLY